MNSRNRIGRRGARSGNAAMAALAAWTAAAGLTAAGCSGMKSQLGDPAGAMYGNAYLLPEGFTPLVGLNPDNPDHYPHDWPAYIVCEADNMVMVFVDGGEFEMGDGPDRRRVRLDPFYIDLHEVTNSQFDRFRKDRRFETAWRRAWNRPWMESNAFHTYASEYYPFRIPSKQKLYPEIAHNFWFWEGQTPKDVDFYLDYWEPGLNNDNPVRSVSWWEAWLYTQWARKMLPTEAQWELAARGKRDRREFPWGDDTSRAGELCNSGEETVDDGRQYAASVMEFASGVSPYGCYNMAGNVWEWCLDNHDPFFGRRPRTAAWVDPHPYEPHEHGGGHLDTRSGVEVNPVGPLHGDERTLRGGAFTAPLNACKVTSRKGARPDVHQLDVGFRCVLPLPPTVADVTPQAAAISLPANVYAPGGASRVHFDEQCKAEGRWR